MQYIDAQHKFQGLITYGEKENERLPIATCAIVFMINGINIPISLPVAHEFITSLNAELKANILISVITAVLNTGAEILNIGSIGVPNKRTYSQ